MIQGDCRQALASQTAGSVHTCVTSPPYYGLRDYQTAQWVGGQGDCLHKVRNPATATLTSTLGGGKKTTGHQQEGYRDICPRCGARRVDQQLGMETTPEQYIDNLVTVFRSVRRVLRSDGTLWVNLGDSYRRKSLLGIPWRVALALQADGWHLRSEIIWHKPNCMPESVKDRPTRAHEQIFLLTKSRRYYYDTDAVREPSTGQNGQAASFRRDTKDHVIPNQSAAQHRMDRDDRSDTGYRNLRSVWTVATRGYKEAHFATFPPALIEPCILAGSPPGGLVLDPFAGSGTTGAVALAHGRSFIGVELNAAYVAMAERRLHEQR